MLISCWFHARTGSVAAVPTGAATGAEGGDVSARAAPPATARTTSAMAMRAAAVARRRRLLFALLVMSFCSLQDLSAWIPRRGLKEGRLDFRGRFPQRSHEPNWLRGDEAALASHDAIASVDAGRIAVHATASRCCPCTR